MENKYIVIYKVTAPLFVGNIHFLECNTEDEIKEKVKELINTGSIDIKVAEKIPFKVNVELTR
jgi:hypothetical protein